MSDFLHNDPGVQQFIGTPEYETHKAARFHGADREIPLTKHPALLLPDKNQREAFAKHYKSSSKLYYGSQPDFELVLATIQENIEDL